MPVIICVTEARRAKGASVNRAGDENEGCGGELKTSLTITGIVSVCSGLVCSGVFGLGSDMSSDMEKLYYFSLSFSPLGEVYLSLSNVRLSSRIPERMLARESSWPGRPGRIKPLRVQVSFETALRLLAVTLFKAAAVCQVVIVHSRSAALSVGVKFRRRHGRSPARAGGSLL